MAIFWDAPLLWLVAMKDGTTVQITSSEHTNVGDFIEFVQVFRMSADERRARFLHVPPPDSDPERVPMVVAKIARSSVSSVSSGMAG